MTVRRGFFIISLVVLAFIVVAGSINAKALYLLFFAVPLLLVGVYDVLQTRSNVLRNFPIVGHLRFMLLKIRPQIHQYFIENETDANPFSREQRELVYQRSQKMNDNIPFGTLRDVYATGYEWMSHSITPKEIADCEMKINIGGGDCTQPYLASRLNISAMSFGALGKKAIMALNKGAKLGGFAHNTGEGGVTPYHLEYGGDLVMQVGTGYFGCRYKDTGKFNPEMFVEKANHIHVKMIEIKLSQGAKPAHGGILPAAKVTAEIAKIRHVPEGKDCVSPPCHSAFSTPIELLQFVAKLRELSGGKPVGFKLCIGVRAEFMAICKAMLSTGILPDFITVDGAEGGTGAAPIEFSNSVGMPLNEGLIFVHNCLLGIDVRDKIRLIASAKVVTGFDIAKKLALGADMCNIARPMMFSLGCIQSRQCHLNTCPTGIATQDASLMYGISVDDKAERVCHYHDASLKNFREVLGAAGLRSPDNLLPEHIWRRVNADEGIKNYSQLYKYLHQGDLLTDRLDWEYAYEWQSASKDCFAPDYNKKPVSKLVS